MGGGKESERTSEERRKMMRVQRRKDGGTECSVVESVLKKKNKERGENSKQTREYSSVFSIL